MKKIIYIIIVIVVLIGLIFIITKNKTPKDTSIIKIGVAVDLSGYAANWGEGEVKAVQLALDQYKDKISQPVELIIENTKGNDVGTVSAVKKLIEIDHVQAIIGPTWGDSYQGGMPIAEQKGIAMISPSAAIETLKNKEKFTYFFSTWWPQTSEINTLIDHMNLSDIKRLAIVNDQDPFDIEITDSLKKNIEANGKISVVSREMFPVGVKDFRTIIAKIKSNRPEAVFIQVTDTSTMGPFMKQLKEQNVNIKVYTTPDAENTDNITKFPNAFDGILYAFPSYGQDSSYNALVDRLKSKYGAGASQGPSFVNAYNAATMLFEVLKGGARTGTEIRDALNRVNVPGVGSKDLSFSPQGQLQDVTFIMKTITNNQFQEVK